MHINAGFPETENFSFRQEYVGYQSVNLISFLREQFREFTSSDEICEKYPHMSQDRVREFTLSALKRMHLASQKEEIL